MGTVHPANSVVPLPPHLELMFFDPENVVSGWEACKHHFVDVFEF